MPRISAASNAAQRAETQHRILTAFGELLFTHGLPGLTMTDVARHARSTVLLAAAAAGIAAIDAVHVDIDDLAGLETEATDAAAVGFAATACIHPGQVATIRAAYAPTEAEAHWARRVVAASEHDGGAFLLDGRMVDAPIVRQARRVVQRIDRSP